MMYPSCMYFLIAEAKYTINEVNRNFEDVEKVKSLLNCFIRDVDSLYPTTGKEVNNAIESLVSDLIEAYYLSSFNNDFDSFSTYRKRHEDRLIDYLESNKRVRWSEKRFRDLINTEKEMLFNFSSHYAESIGRKGHKLKSREIILSERTLFSKEFWTRIS